MENLKNNITANMRDNIKYKLENKFFPVQFRAYWHSLLEAHVIAVNDYDLYHSDKFTDYLCDLEEQYTNQFDIFDICFAFEVFENKNLNVLSSILGSEQVSKFSTLHYNWRSGVKEMVATVNWIIFHTIIMDKFNTTQQIKQSLEKSTNLQDVLYNVSRLSSIANKVVKVSGGLKNIQDNSHSLNTFTMNSLDYMNLSSEINTIQKSIESQDTKIIGTAA